MSECRGVELSHYPEVRVAGDTGPIRDRLWALAWANSGIIMSTYCMQGPRPRAVSEVEPALTPIFGLTSQLRGEADVQGTARSYYE